MQGGCRTLPTRGTRCTRPFSTWRLSTRICTRLAAELGQQSCGGRGTQSVQQHQGERVPRRVHVERARGCYSFPSRRRLRPCRTRARTAGGEHRHGDRREPEDGLLRPELGLGGRMKHLAYYSQVRTLVFAYFVVAFSRARRLLIILIIILFSSHLSPRTSYHLLAVRLVQLAPG